MSESNSTKEHNKDDSDVDSLNGEVRENTEAANEEFFQGGDLRSSAKSITPNDSNEGDRQDQPEQNDVEIPEIATIDGRRQDDHEENSSKYLVCRSESVSTGSSGSTEFVSALDNLLELATLFFRQNLNFLEQSKTLWKKLVQRILAYLHPTLRP